MEYKAPNSPPKDDAGYEIFLAGSIEMGAAELWQDKIAKIIDEVDPKIIVYNPRRDDWDSSWKQSITDPQFNEQVNWELDNLERSQIAFFYFDPKTKSPITLMELGTMVGDYWKDRVIVCCPEGFWRKGNIEIICHRNGFHLFDNWDDAVTDLKRFLPVS